MNSTELNNEINMDRNTTDLQTERAPKFPFLLRRFVEFILTSIACSVPIALLYKAGFLPYTNEWAIRLMGFSLFVFIAVSVYILRAFFYSMGNKKIYFNVNLVAYSLFALLNIVCFLYLGDNELPSTYSYLFMPMKFFNVILNMIISTESWKVQILAPVTTHILMFLIIIISPMEMYRFEKKKK